jgi:hypothetical protein
MINETRAAEAVIEGVGVSAILLGWGKAWKHDLGGVTFHLNLAGEA